MHSSVRGLNSWDRLGNLSLIGATVLSGLLAGIDLNRVAVEMHAWEQVGATEWAVYSQHADLANGLFLYPFEAIGAALLTMGAIGCFHVSRVDHHRTLRFLYAALALSIVGLLLTMKAAPIMLGIRDVSDPAALQRAFERFFFWGNLRSVCQIAAFVSVVCGLACADRHALHR